VGIGNIIHGDDGAGVVVARMLRDHPRLPRETRVIEGGTLGLELLPYLQDEHRIVIVDAMDMGEPAGTTFCLRGEDVRRLKGAWSVHQLGVADLLMALQLVRDDVPGLTLVGVQPKSTDWRTELSPEVDGALPKLIDLCVEESHRSS